MDSCVSKINKNKCIILLLFPIFLLSLPTWLFKISGVCNVKGIPNQQGLQRQVNFVSQAQYNVQLNRNGQNLANQRNKDSTLEIPQFD